MILNFLITRKKDSYKKSNDILLTSSQRKDYSDEAEQVPVERTTANGDLYLKWLLQKGQNLPVIIILRRILIPNSYQLFCIEIFAQNIFLHIFVMHIRAMF